jgi:hypothetical protein
MSRRWAAALCIVVALVTLGPSLAGCSSGQATARLDSYRLGPGTREVTLTYTTGRRDRSDKAEVIRQTPREVVVKVTYEHDDSTDIGLGVSHEATITLAEPLGTRKVLDDQYNQVPVETAPAPDSTSTIGP